MIVVGLMFNKMCDTTSKEYSLVYKTMERCCQGAHVRYVVVCKGVLLPWFPEINV